jgi:hypothetical protein
VNSTGFAINIIIRMLVYYTFQDSNGRPFLDNSTKQTWAVDIPSFVNIGEMKELLGFRHLLDPLSLTMLNFYRSLENVENVEESTSYRFGSCVDFPMIVSVDKEQNLDTPFVRTRDLPISRVLSYLVSRDTKYQTRTI